ncbi:hypothetical protein [Paenibacillus sp. DMB20]|uniref:hypothetical protein n=1 Tax=Paenibacillus sp. DMB20 TaxID=1642570 RepID=UPI000627A041|nr:hypothetical protein [Paenibacillus sp. DMB20]KKO53414.1 hypothetical protein XI25_14110 [Paenibacillus sp. DMB20]
MQIINPVNAGSCRPYIGRHVCAVLHDGTEVVGVLKDVNDRGIMFEPVGPQAAVLSHNPVKSKKKGAAKKKAETSAFYPGYYGFGYPFRRILAFETIALLFLLPFFFI